MGATGAQRAQDGARTESRHRSGEAAVVARTPAGGGQRPADVAADGWGIMMSTMSREGRETSILSGAESARNQGNGKK